jgi:hypothetical protein
MKSSTKYKAKGQSSFSLSGQNLYLASEEFTRAMISIVGGYMA